MAGAHNLNPADAGFGSFVKMWKPFFIGRRAFVEHEESRDQVIVRFRMSEKGVRRPETGDPVLDRRGKVVGHVTSCAIDSEGYLLGQAILPEGMTEPGTALYVYQLGGGTYLRSTAVMSYNLQNDTYSVPVGLGIGQVIPTPKAVFNLFIEPQWSVADKGAGWGQWQVFIGLNTQFK